MWCYRENDFVCMAITPKNLMMQTDLKLNFPIETLRIPKNIKHVLNQNLFIPRCTCTTWECVIQKKSFSFAFKLIRACTKHWIIICSKNAIRQDKSIYSYHTKGFPLKFRFCFCIWLCVLTFNEQLALELWKLVVWVKIWQSICSQSNSWLWTFNIYLSDQNTNKYYFQCSICQSNMIAIYC